MDLIKNRMRRFRALAALLTLALVLMGACSPPEAEETVETAPETLPAEELPSPEPTAIPHTAEIPPLTEEALANGRYWIEELGEFQLNDGEYEDRYGDGATMVNRVGLETAALGELDGDGSKDAAVLLWWDSGGSGTYRFLVAVLNELNGPRQVGLFFLGDRVRVQSLAVEGGEIVLEALSYGPEDPLCCPTQRVLQRYVLDDGGLVMTTSELIGRETGHEALLGVIWQCVAWDDLVVPYPPAYRLELSADGGYQVLADCNRASGAFSLAGQELILNPGPSTLAECEPGSLYSDYLAALGAVRAFSTAGESLILTLEGGGELIFSPLHAVTGRITGPEGAELPEDAVVEVAVVDDEGSQVGGQSSLAPGQFPIDFETSYDAPSIRPEGNYYLEVRVVNGAGGLIFRAAGAVPVLTQGNPTRDLELVVEAASPVEGLWWWQETMSPMGPLGPVPDPEKYSLELLPGGELRFTADCKSGGGTYTVEGSGIQIELGEITGPTCPPGSLSDPFIQDLEAAALFFFQEETLFFDLIYDSGTMRLTPAD